jgi:hypothetical protein
MTNEGELFLPFFPLSSRYNFTASFVFFVTFLEEGPKEAASFAPPSIKTAKEAKKAA